MRRRVRLLFALMPLSGALGWGSIARPTPLAVCTGPSIWIGKHAARLELRCQEGTSAYPVTFGASPIGHKQRRGDERTPEGRYLVSAKVKSARFHRFLKLSYPNAADLARARTAGLDPGSGIGIHGVHARLAGLARLFIRSAGALSSRAWGPTDGCIGMINEDVEAVFERVAVGTAVTIDP